MLPNKINIWIKISYTIIVAITIPSYWYAYGPTNFLWFSDIALILMVPALWLENRLIPSMLAVGVMPIEIAWTIDFICRGELIGLAAYMFEDKWSLYLRFLSLFHVPLPWLILLMVYKFGYDPRALVKQTLLLSVIMPVTYVITNPINNINWVFGLSETPSTTLPPLLFLCLLMISLFLFLYTPMHFILKKYFPIQSIAT